MTLFYVKFLYLYVPMLGFLGSFGFFFLLRFVVISKPLFDCAEKLFRGLHLLKS
jgi:hypothetical protein